MDVLLNNLNNRDQVVQAFPLECLEQFKPVVDVLHALLGWHGRLVEMTILTNTVERIKSFFEQLRRKLYSGGGRVAHGITATRQRQNINQTNEAGEYKEYVFADNMAQFLEMTLQESVTTLNKYLNQADGVLLVRCYPVDQGMNDQEHDQGNRIFSVNSNVKYAELQDTIDAKFNATGCLAQYIAEDE